MWLGGVELSRRYHFDSISHDNSALSSSILTCPPPTPSGPGSGASTPTPLVLTGTQSVQKFSGASGPRRGHETDSPDTVWIALALWRVWIRSEPHHTSGSAESREGGRGMEKKADVVCSVNVNMSSAAAEEERKRVEGWWMKAVRGLEMRDFGLFGAEPG